MLYDILMIDDDFSLTNDSKDVSWTENAIHLYLKLVRKNLRVIWTTGEIEDLKRLDASHLHSIKHIICDLHLTGIKERDSNELIISKIMSIFKELNDNLKEEKITVYISSKYIQEHQGIDIELPERVSSRYKDKYKILIFTNKNAIEPTAEKALIEEALLNHVKNQIISKHAELDRCIGDTFLNNKEPEKEEHRNKHEKLYRKLHKYLSFPQKLDIAKNFSPVALDQNLIGKFNSIRNQIAHEPVNSLRELRAKEGLPLDTFSNLSKTIEKIDSIIKNIELTKPKTHT